MLLFDLIDSARTTSRENQARYRQILRDPELDVESRDVELRLERKASGLWRIHDFLSLVRKSVAEIHKKSVQDTDDETPDDVFWNISATLISDLKLRSIRQTVLKLLSPT